MRVVGKGGLEDMWRTKGYETFWERKVRRLVGKGRIGDLWGEEG